MIKKNKNVPRNSIQYIHLCSEYIIPASDLIDKISYKAHDLNKVKKHESGDPLTDDKPAYDLNKVKKHESGDPLTDDKPAYDLNKVKKHETGDSLVDDKPAYDLNKVKKHESGDPLTDDKPAYDLNKVKKHETGDSLVDDKPAYDIKHETGEPSTDNKPVYDLDKLKKHEATEFLVDGKPAFIPIQTRQMKTQAQIRKLVQSDNVQHDVSDMKKPNESHARKLPRTGSGSVLGLIFSGLAVSLLGLWGLKKKDHNL